MELELEQREQRWHAGKLAYQGWLRNKQEEDELVKKEREFQRELRRLQAQEEEEDRRRAKEVFIVWKEQKDLELKLERQLEREERRSLTPPPRGSSHGETLVPSHMLIDRLL